MKNIFIFTMFLFFIIAPFLYLLYTFRKKTRKFKVTLTGVTATCFITLLIKVFIQPSYPWFYIITLLIQAYVIVIIVFAILCLFYQVFCHYLHKEIYIKVYLIFSIISVLLTGFGFYTHFQKTIKTYDVIVQKETSLKELNIAMISDVHLGTGTYLKDIKKLVNQVNQNNYDLVVFCGDIFDESTTPSMIKDSLQLFSTIKTKYGMYAVNGNHEYYGVPINESLFKDNNIQLLTQSYVCIDGLFNIVGRDDISITDGISMKKICTNMDTSLPTIVLDHNPKRYQEAIDYADIQFSGHTHGGQLFPVTLATSAIYDNAYGLTQEKDFSLIVSSGYGSWGFPFRFLTNCEIVQTKVTFTKK